MTRLPAAYRASESAIVESALVESAEAVAEVAASTARRGAGPEASASASATIRGRRRRVSRTSVRRETTRFAFDSISANVSAEAMASR